MGYSLSWLAVKGKTPDTVLSQLRLRATGAREEIPEAPLSASQLPNGWFLIVSQRTEQVAPDLTLWHLTADCEVVTCFVEEHVMYSSAAGWKDGRRCWSITHCAEHGIDHLESEGDLPGSFSFIRDRQIAKQKEEESRKDDLGCDHIFDIPVAVAQELTGYRYDQNIDGFNGETFEVLTRIVEENVIQKPLSRLWKKLSGR